ncbi:MAG: hypothetical protein V3T05_10700 [Myxococcota bacterium]
MLLAGCSRYSIVMPGDRDEEPWYGLGSSELAPFSVRVAGSASGAGLNDSLAAFTSPRVAVDPSGVPFVAWSEAAQIQVKRLNGATWEGLSGNANTGIRGAAAAVAVASGGRATLAWNEARVIKLRRYSSNVWEELDGSAGVTGISGPAGVSDVLSNPSLAVDAGGNPAVAWWWTRLVGTVTTQGIFFKRFNGTAWQALGGSDAGTGIAASEAAAPEVALESDGNPVVAWSAANQVFLLRYDSGSDAWVGMGGSELTGTISTGAATSTRLAIDGADRPILAWVSAGEVFVKRYDGASAWVELDGSATTPGLGPGSNPALAVQTSSCTDTAGCPLVAYEDAGTGVSQIHVQRFDGTSWVADPVPDTAEGVSDSVGASVGPQLAVAPDGGEILAWADSSDGAAAVYVRRRFAAAWDETTTREGEGISDSAAASTAPALAIDASGTPFVAWVEPSSSGMTEIYLRKYDSGSRSWIELGGSARAAGVSYSLTPASAPSLALDATGVPHVAWQNATDIVVKRFDGTAWVALGRSENVSSSVNVSAAPSLAIGAGPIVVIAWHEKIGAISELRVSRFDRAALEWVDVGESSTGGLADPAVSAMWPAIVLDSTGTPLVTWQQGNRIHVKRLDAATDPWRALPGTGVDGRISNAAVVSTMPVMALDTDDHPVVAWLGAPAGLARQVYALAHDGSSWRELRGSSTGPGLSGTVGVSSEPSLAIDGDGNPVIAWTDVTSGMTETFFRRFRQEIWDEVGGSATWSGVSNSNAISLTPSVATGGGLTCIAWSESGRKYKQITMRCVRPD